MGTVDGIMDTGPAIIMVATGENITNQQGQLASQMWTMEKPKSNILKNVKPKLILKPTLGSTQLLITIPMLMDILMLALMLLIPMLMDMQDILMLMDMQVTLMLQLLSQKRNKDC